jgi:integrase
MATGIYKRGLTYWIHYTDQHGKFHRESARSKKFSVAQGLLTKRRNAIDAGKNMEDEKRRLKRFTFGELADKYLVFCKSQRGYLPKKSVVEQLKKKFEDYPLRNLTMLALETYQQEMLAAKIIDPENPDAPNPPNKYAVATVNKRLTVIRHMLTKAVDWNMVEEETRRKAYKVKLKGGTVSRLRYLQYSECEKLLSNCLPHLKPIVMTALHTGMRRGEILSLRWDDVDMKNRFIFLRNTTTKSGKPREIPINDTLYGVLKSLPRRIDVPWVFPNPSDLKPSKDGTPVKSVKPIGDVKNSFRAACTKAGIRDFTFHDLRHTFASHLVMEGVDITTVSRLLGHASLTMTLRYAHLAPKHMASAVNVLSKKIGG